MQKCIEIQGVHVYANPCWVGPESAREDFKKMFPENSIDDFAEVFGLNFPVQDFNVFGFLFSGRTATTEIFEELSSRDLIPINFGQFMLVNHMGRALTRDYYVPVFGSMNVDQKMHFICPVARTISQMHNGRIKRFGKIFIAQTERVLWSDFILLATIECASARSF